MKRIHKAVVAIASAISIAVVGASSLTAYAYNTTEEYETSHKLWSNNPPTYTGTESNVYVAYSTYGAICYQHHAGSDYDDGTGNLYITSLNGTMNGVTMQRADVHKNLSPSYVGITQYAGFKLRAYSTTTGATYSSDGNVNTKATP